MSMMHVGHEAVESGIVSNRPAGYPAGKVANGPQQVVLDKARTIESFGDDACSVVGKWALGFKVFRRYLVVVDRNNLNYFEIGLLFA